MNRIIQHKNVIISKCGFLVCKSCLHTHYCKVILFSKPNTYCVYVRIHNIILWQDLGLNQTCQYVGKLFKKWGDNSRIELCFASGQLSHWMNEFGSREGWPCIVVLSFFIVDFGRQWSLYSEIAWWHVVTLEQFEKFKMASKMAAINYKWP